MSDVATQLEDLRDTVGEIDALAAFTLDAFDRADWGDADRQIVERMAYALSMISRTAALAASKLDGFHVAVADVQPATACECWDYEKGTASAPGDEPAVSPQDAAIVRRIRERCQDGRFDGASDAELLEMFKQNKRVLARSDEDIIGAIVEHGRRQGIG